MSEVERTAPWGLLIVPIERRRTEVQIVAVWTEMVVDDIQEYLDAKSMRFVDQCFKRVRFAIGAIWRKRQHAVVSPVAFSCKCGQRHQLDGGDAESGKSLELKTNTIECAGCRECTDMQFKQHRLFPAAALPPHGLPTVGGRVDNDRRLMRAARLGLRGRIGHGGFASYDELILTARPRRVGDQLKPTGAFGGKHGHVSSACAVTQANFRGLNGRGPKPETYNGAVEDLSAERHCMAHARRS